MLHITHKLGVVAPYLQYKRLLPSCISPTN